MQDGVAALHRVFHAMRITDVPAKNLKVPFDISGAVVEPTPRVERVVQDEGLDAVAGADERLSQMRADEAIRPSDEHLFGLMNHQVMGARSSRSGMLAFQWSSKASSKG